MADSRPGAGEATPSYHPADAPGLGGRGPGRSDGLRGAVRGPVAERAPRGGPELWAPSDARTAGGLRSSCGTVSDCVNLAGWPREDHKRPDSVPHAADRDPDPTLGSILPEGREREGVMMLPELLVTDFAGTTMRDDGAVLAAYRLALGEHDIPYTEAELAARRGASKRAVFQELAARGRQDTDAAGVAEQALA